MMNHRKMIGLLAVLLLFSMACGLTGNLLGGESESDSSTLSPLNNETTADEDAADPQGVDPEEPSVDADSQEDPAEDDEEMEEEPADAQSETTESEAGVITSGACYNPYFPVVEDRILVYENRMEEAAEWESTHEMEFRDVSNEAFTSVFRYYETDIEGNPVSDDLIEVGIAWQCSEDGLLQKEFTFFLFEPIEEMVEVEYETVEFQGVTFPNEEDFEVGTRWESDYVVKINTTIEGVTASSQADIHEVSTVVGFEAISVAYGDFENALRVDTVLELVLTASTEDGTAFSIETESLESTWYVEGIGMVKQVSEQNDQTSTYIQELSAIK